MSNTTHPGIDYAGPASSANRDSETRIRYGIISANDCNPDAIADLEPDYGKPTCPKCGKQADKPDEFGESQSNGHFDDFTREPHECDDYVCVDCKHFFGSESACGDEPIGHYLDSADEEIMLDSSNDVWVMRSPYFTYAQFCSPCAPGACHLNSPLDIDVGPLGESIDPSFAGNRCYCLGVSWFDNERPPYRIWEVASGNLVYSPDENTENVHEENRQA